MGKTMFFWGMCCSRIGLPVFQDHMKTITDASSNHHCGVKQSFSQVGHWCLICVTSSLFYFIHFLISRYTQVLTTDAGCNSAAPKLLSAIPLTASAAVTRSPLTPLTQLGLFTTSINVFRVFPAKKATSSSPCEPRPLTEGSLHGPRL